LTSTAKFTIVFHPARKLAAFKRDELPRRKTTTVVLCTFSVIGAALKLHASAVF
jgi:hypothetical protein